MNSILSNFYGILLWVDFLVICTLVWVTIRRQVDNIPNPVRKRWITFTRLSMIIPGVVLFVIGLLIGLVWRTEPEARIVHAMVVLSLWMPVTFMMFSMLASRRSKALTLILPSFVYFFAGVPILRLTPIDGFHTVFDPIGYGIPLLMSLGVIGFMYWVFIYVYKKINRLPKPAIEIKLKVDSSE